MSTERAEFAIVGGGLLGLAAAWALRRRGRTDVVVLEQATVGHERGGSKGASRIFRYGYDDPMYVRMAMAARPLWDELDPSLLTTTGQLTLGADMDALQRARHDAGVPVQRLAAAEVRERFPGIAVPGDALFEPESAVIDAAATLRALARGVIVREHTRVSRIDDDGRRVRIDDTVAADIAIVCPGPWSPQFVDGTHATLEHVAYFRPRPDAPIFVEFADPTPYGLPTPQLDAYKIALHHAGARVDAETVAALRRFQAASGHPVQRGNYVARRWLYILGVATDESFASPGE